MEDDIHRLRALLHRHGHSLTAARSTVLTALAGQEPLTMRELIGRCRSVDRASTYRTVALFEQLGVVQRVRLGWKYKIELSDAFQHHHHHLSCTACGAVRTITESAALERHLHRLARAYGFAPADHQLEIRGRCASCQAAAPKPYSS